MINPKVANQLNTVSLNAQPTKILALPSGGQLIVPLHHYHQLLIAAGSDTVKGVYFLDTLKAARIYFKDGTTQALYKYLYPFSTHCRHKNGNPADYSPENLILRYPDTNLSNRRAVNAVGVPLNRQTRPNLPIPSLPTDKPSTVRLSAKSSAAGFDSFVVDADTWELLQELFNSGMATPATIRLNGHGRETVFISVDKKQMQLHVFLSNLPRTKFKNYDRMDLRLENLI